MEGVSIEQLLSNLTDETWVNIQEFVTSSSDQVNNIKEFMEKVDLPMLFIAIEYSYSQACPPEKQNYFARLSKQAISKIFKSSLGPSLALTNAAFIQAGMGHAHPELRKGALQLVHDLLNLKPSVQLGGGGEEEPEDLATSRKEFVASFLLQGTVISLLIQAMMMEQVSTAELALGLLLAAGKVGPRESALALVAGAQQEAVKKDATLQLRFADAAAKLAGLSDETFNVAQEAGALNLVWEPLLETDDILARLNALDLVPLVAASTAGLVHLFQQGSVRSLLNLAMGDKEKGLEPDPILGPNALVVLSKLYICASSVITSEGRPLWSEVGDTDLTAAFLHAALAHLDSRNEGSRLSAIDAVSSLAMVSSEALKLILEDNTLLTAWIHFYGMKVEMKAACLHSVARVLLPLEDDRAKLEMHVPSTTSNIGQGEEKESGNNDETNGMLKQRLFAQLGTINDAASSLDLLLGCIRQPVDELRFAGYDVLRAVAGQPQTWGIFLVFGDPGVVAILKNRETEISKLGKEWKFSVVEAGMKSPHRSLLATDTVDDFQKILQDGPFCSKAQVGEMQTMA